MSPDGSDVERCYFDFRESRLLLIASCSVSSSWAWIRSARAR